MNKKIAYSGVAVCALAAALLIGARAADPAPQAAGPQPLAPASRASNPEFPAFAALAKRLEPSVVKITVTVGQRISQSRGGDQGDENDDDMLRRFFGNGRGLPEQFRGHGTGSGVIVDAKGYIITNHHVIDRADRIQVKLAGDETEYNAKLIGSDRESDLAVIKIDAPRPLAAAAIGNSDAVQVGEWAIAIGAPFGFERTVTAGIISAKGRDLGDREHPLPRFLQTDAAINHGNSGGPLLNIRGEVIGISSAMATESGGYEGIGFAIPINMAVKVYNDIIRIGKVSRGAIGITFNPQAKPELLKAYGASEGVFVESVAPGGPGEKAGLQLGDIIVGFQGQPIKNGDDLLTRLGDTPVGSQTTLTVMRDGKRMDLHLTVADRAELNAAARPGRSGAPSEPGDAGTTRVRFGMSVQELTATDKRELNFSGKTGILVTNVDPGSFAEDIGLLEGDIVTEMNRRPIQSLDDLKRLQSSLKPGDAVAFHVLRSTRRGGGDWQPVFVAGTVPNR